MLTGAWFVLFLVQAAVPATTLVAADTLFQKGDFKAAAQIYGRMAQLDPKNEMVQSGLIRALLNNDDIEVAQAAAQEAREALPSSSLVFAAAGDVLLRRGRLTSAADAYFRATQTNPRNGRAYLGMAKLYSSDFNRKSARLMVQKAFEHTPEDPEVILAFATGLPAAAQLPLLEKYLAVGLNEPEPRLDEVRRRLGYLKVMGDRRTWLLQGEPRTATLELESIALASNRPTGYTLKASINGKKSLDLKLDTGASGLLISRKLATNLGLEVIAESTVGGIGDEGRRKAFVSMARTVRVGGIEFRDCTIEVADNLPGDTGVIGCDVFQQFLVTLDLPASRVQLEPLPAIAGVRYDDPDSWGEFDRRPVPELGDFAQVRRWGHLLLDTLVNGVDRGFFYLDTGAASSVIDIDLARKTSPIQSANVVVTGVSGRVENVSAARDVTLQVGRFRQKNNFMLAISLKETSKMLGLELSGLLGHPLLSQLVISIDYRDGLLNLAYPGQRK